MAQTQYTVGFAFDEFDSLALIRKNRPAWQVGRFNGLGGHVEPFESFGDCIVREFEEECGVATSNEMWRRFASISSPSAYVAFFVARDLGLNNIETTTDEPVVVFDLDSYPFDRCVPNLQWLIPLALNEPETAGDHSRLTVLATYG